MRQRRYVLAGAVLLAIALGADAAQAGFSPRDLDALAKADTINIATVRKSGMQSKSAPVWFIVTADKSALLIQTGPKSWKAKRIARGSPALVWIGSAKGPAFIGKAEITSEAAIQQKIIDEYPQKYLLARVGFARPTHEKFDRGDIVAIKITPLRDLPDGFVSAPGQPPPPLEGAGAPPLH